MTDRNLAALAGEFFTAASRNDTLTLARIVDDSQPLEIVDYFQKHERSFLQSAAKTATIEETEPGEQGSVLAVFVLDHGGSREDLIIHFTKRGGTWKVHRIHLPDRI